MSQIVIISGNSGAGKSATCESLCERYDRTVHLETDDVYGWLRMGRIPPWKEGSSRQNHMVSRACAHAATAFAQEGYGVFIDGVIGPHLLPEYLDELRTAAVPVHYVVLRPHVATAEERVHQRGERLMGSREIFERVQAMFEGELPGWALDNTGMTPDQAADLVMEACGRGDALVWTPG
jgi:chloramphenicol 3-O-phosphotransferase